MAENSKIQWCDHTFNPWIGCSKVHTGCANCYAEADFDKRRKRVTWGPGGTRVRTSVANWKHPVTWNATQAEVLHAEMDAKELGIPPSGKWRRPRVFCASLADVFEDWDDVIRDHRGAVLGRCQECHHTEPMRAHCSKCGSPQGDLTMDDCRRDLFELIDNTPNIDWLLLTKRPENIQKMWPLPQNGRDPSDPLVARRENVWLGCSVSDQETADRLIPKLLECRDLSPRLFVSVEPLLDFLTLQHIATDPPYESRDCLHGCLDNYVYQESYQDDKKLDWVIVGGESGPGARPCEIEWIESIVRQCKVAEVPCFVKQVGSNPNYWDDGGMQGNESIVGFQVAHPKGGDPDEWPREIQVQEFPVTERWPRE